MSAVQPHAPHAVSRLRSERLARSSKPFLARGGSRIERCAGCRLPPSHCLCDLRPAVAARAGVCLLMADIEPLKPSNTGWQLSRYRLRRSRRDEHVCTSEVAALCLELAGDHAAAQMLEVYLDVFTHHYVQARNQQPAAWDSAAHLHLRKLLSI